jgi:hypothetical protein
VSDAGTAARDPRPQGDSERDDASDDDDGDDDGDERTEATEAAEGAAGKKKRRRRRRRAGSGGGEDAAAALPQTTLESVQPKPLLSQDQIVIDIDESELEVVRDQFGEIDELDDLTLRGRRRAVLDDLADEVELEDLTGYDRAQEPASEGDDDDDGDGSETAADADDSGADAASDSDTSEEAAAKKKRRRRRKKKAPLVIPELMVPPHKDFWEAWSAKYNYTEFEDDALPSTHPELAARLQIEPPEPPPRPTPPQEPQSAPRERVARNSQPRGRSIAAGAAAPAASRAPAVAFEPLGSADDDADYVRVRLAAGRSHGVKSAQVRELLASRAGLTGRGVRDLTVRDVLTWFRVPAARVEDLQAALAGLTFAGIDLTGAVAVDEPDADAPALRVPAPALAEHADTLDAGDPPVEDAARGDAATESALPAPEGADSPIAASEAAFAGPTASADVPGTAVAQASPLADPVALEPEPG